MHSKSQSLTLSSDELYFNPVMNQIRVYGRWDTYKILSNKETGSK